MDASVYGRGAGEGFGEGVADGPEDEVGIGSEDIAGGAGATAAATDHAHADQGIVGVSLAAHNVGERHEAGAEQASGFYNFPAGKSWGFDFRHK